MLAQSIPIYTHTAYNFEIFEPAKILHGILITMATKSLLGI